MSEKLPTMISRLSCALLRQALMVDLRRDRSIPTTRVHFLQNSPVIPPQPEPISRSDFPAPKSYHSSRFSRMGERW